MTERPPSAISAFTAVAAGILLIVNVVALIMHWVAAYFLLMCGALAVLVAFNIWAARGSSHS